MNSALDFETFGPLHNIILLITFGTFFFLPWVGKNFLNDKYRSYVVYFLIAISLAQDLLYDMYQLSINDFDLGDDLPLHICGLSLYLSTYALWKKDQLAFELAYFWGITAAFNALLTPDPTRFAYGNLDIFSHFLSHGLVVLNVIWLVWVQSMRCRKGSFFKTLGISTIAMSIIGVINFIIGNGANYWFLSQKPVTESPFVQGDWPFYILGVYTAGVIFFAIAYIPMMFVLKIENKRGTSNY